MRVEGLGCNCFLKAHVVPQVGKGQKGRALSISQLSLEELPARNKGLRNLFTKTLNPKP